MIRKWNISNIYVASILPTVAMIMIDNVKLKEIVEDVEKKLKKVIDNI